ncbi:hypothetical protein Droror1_Dr00006163 [Drosera rotundifolia]
MRSFCNLWTVMEGNGGRPYTDDYFAILREGARQSGKTDSPGVIKQEVTEPKEHLPAAYEKQMKVMAERRRKSVEKLEQQLDEERKAQLEAKEIVEREQQFLKEHEQQFVKDTRLG